MQPFDTTIDGCQIILGRIIIGRISHTTRLLGRRSEAVDVWNGVDLHAMSVFDEYIYDTRLHVVTF